MKLSVIIVNYNVKYFLEQCLYSVQEAQKKCVAKFGENSTEVFVVDNDSKDDSCEMLKRTFPEVNLIENKKNVGFSTANNQAIKGSKGQYILLLNPDTLVAEDTFVKTIDFMDKHEVAGGLGVKMIDGKGNFLPESKRSFPSPTVSFYKMFGFSKLFPKSKKFGKYHLSYLDKNKTHEVDVLSGAFMLMRKKALDKSGLLDENFFMYGEDIDMSFRIKEAGFKNYYYPETSIIHYKGESTKKGSLNYVFMFYNAMVIFAKKHFSNKKVALFSFFIKIAVWLRAGLSVGKRIFKSAFLPIIDSIIFYSGFYFIKPIWESYKFNTESYYPEEYLLYAVPFYVLVWILAIFISKGYRHPIDSKKLFRGILMGSFVILVFYSLLNEEYRYSRALLLLGTVWAMLFSWIFRAIFSLLKITELSFIKKVKKNILIIADNDESKRIQKILNSLEETNSHKNIYTHNFESNFAANVKNEIIEKKINEIIFSLKNISGKKIISAINMINLSTIEIKIAHNSTNAIIGSNSIHSFGKLYIPDLFAISKLSNIRIKRISDIIFSLLFIVLYPILFLLVENKINFLKNIFRVLIGKYSWVGYVKNKNKSNKLPKLKKAVLSPENYLIYNEEDIFRINSIYAKKYNLTDDIYIIYKSFDKIGNKIL